jgi:hypothetical protein
MAEESKSWFPNLGLLSESALTGLSPEVQDQLQRESVKRMVIGGLLSGRPDIGFQSAVGVPNDYIQNQNRLMEIQKIQKQNAETEDFYRRNLPSVPQAGQRALAGQVEAGGRVGPTIQAGQAQQDILNAPVDFQSMYIDIARLGGNPAAANIREAVGKLEPRVGEGGMRTGPGGVYMGTMPQVNATQGLVTGISVGPNGVIQPYSMALPGATTQKAAMTTAEKGAAAQFDFEKVKGQDGTTYLVPKSVISGYSQPPVAAPQPNAPQAPARPSGAANQPPQIPGFVSGVDIAPKPSALSTFVAEQAAPEVAYQEGWKKINDDAYTGYKQATKNAPQIGTLQNIFNRPDFDTNAFAGYKTQLTSVLNAMGIANEKQKDFLNNATSARRAINDFAVNNVSELSGATSDRDIQFSKDRFVTLTDPKQSNQYALDLIAASDARKKQFYSFVQGNRSPDVIQKWENSDQGKSSIFENAAMRKYLPQSTVNDGPYKGQTAYRLPSGEVKVFPK